MNYIKVGFLVLLASTVLIMLPTLLLATGPGGGSKGTTKAEPISGNRGQISGTNAEPPSGTIKSKIGGTNQAEGRTYVPALIRKDVNGGGTF